MRSIEKKPNRVENVFCFLKLENVLWNITYSTANQKRKRKKKSNSGTTTNFTTLLQFCYMINREWWNH